MTLQYRIRSKYEDDRWRQRARICALLLLDAVEEWCKSDLSFAVDDCVRCCLHLFSKRCDLDAISERHVKNQLLSASLIGREEYAAEWPCRTDADYSAISESMSQVLHEAVVKWESDGVGSLRADDVAGQLLDEIIGQQFVVFHHTETTRRDINHWGI